LSSVIVTLLTEGATPPLILFAVSVASSGCCAFGVTDVVAVGVTDVVAVGVKDVVVVVVVALLEDDRLAGVAPVTVGWAWTALPAPHPLRAKTVPATTAAVSLRTVVLHCGLSVRLDRRHRTCRRFSYSRGRFHT
jgi:hypothetical protein